MAHLEYSLYDGVGDNKSLRELSDDFPIKGSYFHNLNDYDSADKAAEISVTLGNKYIRGDHIRLLNHPTHGDTATVSIDPEIKSRVNLNKIYNNGRFADRAAAVKIVRNPNQDGSFRLRVRLYDKTPSTSDAIAHPTLILYDWEFPLYNPTVYLNRFKFDNKTAFIIVEKGPNYLEGDKIILLDSLQKSSKMLPLGPGNYNLNSRQFNFADKAAALQFAPLPPAHLIIHLYKEVGDRAPIHILNDSDPYDPKRAILFHNLNDVDAQDKVKKVLVERGPEYRRGDHIRLLNEVRKAKTDTVCIDPDIIDKVDLYNVRFNNNPFTNRAAGIKIITNPNPDGGFRLRVKLFDMVPSDDQIAYPTFVIYDWQFPQSNPIADLNNFHYADKTAHVIVEKGPNYIEGDMVRLIDKTEIDPDTRAYPIKTPFKEKGYNLNMENWADKAAALTFDLVPPTPSKKPEKVELYEGPVVKLSLSRSIKDSLDHLEDYHGRATSVKIHGVAGSAATFFDDQHFRLKENAVRIRKLVDEPITVDIATNFVNTDEEDGDAVYSGTDQYGKYEWKLFKTVKRNWFHNMLDTLDIPDFDEFLERFREIFEGSESEVAHWVLNGIRIIQATGIGKKSSNNYHVDNCSSVYLDFDKG